MTRLKLAAGVLALTLVVAGCAGPSGTDDTTNATTMETADGLEPTTDDTGIGETTTDDTGIGETTTDDTGMGETTTGTGMNETTTGTGMNETTTGTNTTTTTS